MTNPIIFLDIDGVLNSSEFVQAIGDKWTMDEVDPKAVERLNKIVEATGAEAVISSTWRRIHSLGFIKRVISNAGGKVSVIDDTPKLGGLRGGEIQKWLDENPGHDKFVILDDNSDMEPLSNFLVQTTWDWGLQDEHVERAIEILTKE